LPIGDSADLWRLTVHHSPIGMALVALDGRLMMVNRAFAEMLGYAVDDLTSRGFQEITHPDDLDTDLDHFRRTLDGELDSYRLRKRYLRSDGEIVWGDLSVALVRGPRGEPLHFVSQILDITEQRRQEEQLEAIFETVGVGLLLIGPDGTYQRMNRRHAETMAIPFPDGHEGAAGQLGHVYFADGKTLMKREDMPSYRAMQGEEFDDYTYWVGSDPQTRLAFSASARMVRGSSGERLGAALAYQEITELMRAMQVKDEFVASISHELRTPLTSVLGYLEIVVENEALPAHVRDRLDVVRRNALRLQALVSDLLEVGQLGESGLALQRADVDVARVAREAAQAAEPLADQSGIALSVDLPSSLVAFVDEKRIRQVLDNLLSNAVKYSDEGGRVGLSLRRTDATLELEVSDDGIGIAEEDVPHVFDRFFRGSDALTQHIPGTGLGLNIVGTIIGAHHGSLVVDSALGEGTTFRVSLPLGG
jgi:two-component system, OmpR family, phosphate regulon sensor histidine kinase PhoR